MRQIARFAVLAALTASCDARALGALAEVTVIDRDSGAAMSTYYAGGEYWVAGTPGRRYAIEIRNRTGARLLAVTSVDGVNVLSGATAAVDQGGYVFDAGERYQITGWRKSNAEVAAFVFTALPDSYAARTGRPENVGVIGVALFRERRPPRVYVAPPAPVPAQEAPRGDADRLGAAAAARAGSTPSASAASAPPAASAPSAPAALPFASLPGGTRSDQAPAKSAAVTPESVAPPMSAPSEVRLGTGHGARESSYVVDTDFRRMQREPNEVIRIRYDSLENLVAMGVVRPGQSAAPVPDPFPRSHERRYVPDPPG